MRRWAGWIGWLLVIGMAVLCELEIADNRVVLGATVSKWLVLLLLVLLTPLALDLVRRPLCALLKRWEKFRPEAERLGLDAVHGLGGATALLAISFAWLVMIDPLDLPHPTSLQQGAVVGLIAGAVWLILGLWDAVCQRVSDRAGALDSRAEKLLIPLIRKFVRGIILIAGGLVVLSAFAVDWKSMIAGLGIGGILVALAAKDSVENLFGSVTILFDMPFQIGDLVKVSGVEGTVEEINLRSTRIRTGEDALVTLPNSNLIKASVENFGARRKRRERILMRVGYATPPDKLVSVVSSIKDFLREQAWVVQENTVVEVQDLGEVSISVLIQFFVIADNYAEEMAQRGLVITTALSLAEAHGVQFASVPPLPTPPSA